MSDPLRSAVQRYAMHITERYTLRDAVTTYAGDGIISDDAAISLATEHATAANSAPESSLTPTRECPDGERHVLRCIRCELPASASPDAKGEGWQPIDTAPKDRLIDVWWRDLRMPDARWQADWREWSTLDGHILYGPTHWRLRPDPPSALPASLEEKIP